EHTIESWDWHWAINVRSAGVLTRAAAPILLAQRSGKVINLASTAAVRGIPDLAPYCATKGALVQMTRALAVEWAPQGVQVNAIGPGAYDTELQPDRFRSAGPALDARLARIPDGRMGQAQEVAPLACYLASSLS